METPNLSSSSTSTNSNTDESDSTSENNISTSEEENKDLLFPLMRYLITGRRRHRIENYIQVVDSWTDQEFKKQFTVNTKHCIQINRY